MKSEFTLAFNEISERSKLTRETIIEAIEAAVISAYRKAAAVSGAQQVEAVINPDSGEITVYAEKEVIPGLPQDERTEVSLEEAKRSDPDAEVGDLARVDSTALFQGRIPAQTAKQVILQKLKEAERESQYQEYIEREDDLVHGTVQSTGSHGVTLSLGRAEAIMPRNQTMPRERFRPHDKVRGYVLEVRRTPRGPQIIVSRTHRNMLRRLLEMEVPEVYSGAVEIKSIAREAGQRSKVAVASIQDGVDPVGACVGMRGVRIQSIVKELSDEKIDVIEWNPDQSIFITKSLSPARVAGVYLAESPTEGRTATVVVPDDQLSLAIGREGQNARLAAKLTGWRIDIKSLSEASHEAIGLLHDDEPYAELGKQLDQDINQARLTLGKMAENRPVMPEEYTVLSNLVDAVESKRHALMAIELQALQARLDTVRETIPETAYSLSLEFDAALAPGLLATLLDAGYQNVGQILEQIALDADKILALPGVGPKVMTKMRDNLTEIANSTPAPSQEDTSPPEEIEDSLKTDQPLDQDSDDLDDDEIAEDLSETQAPTEPSKEDQDPNLNLDLDPQVPETAGSERDLFLPDPELEVLDQKKGKTKKQKRTVIYDDERDVYITTHERKRGRAKDDWLDDLDVDE